MSIQRWTAYVEDDDGNDLFVCVSPDARGEWIRYSDHEAEVERLQARERELEATARPLLDHLWTSSARLPTGETIRLLRALGDVLDSKPLNAVSAEKEDDDE